MHQASIIMTFFVFVMGAAWFGLESGLIGEQMGLEAEAQAVSTVDPAAVAPAG